MNAEDGKMRKTDVATPEQLFRLIQSIPSSTSNVVSSPNIAPEIVR